MLFLEGLLCLSLLMHPLVRFPLCSKNCQTDCEALNSVHEETSDRMQTVRTIRLACLETMRLPIVWGSDPPDVIAKTQQSGTCLPKKADLLSLIMW